MILNWQKWGLDFWTSVVRHTASSGIAYFAVIETQKLPFTWSGLGAAVVAGGFVRAALVFLERSPAPEVVPDKPQNNEKP